MGIQHSVPCAGLLQVLQAGKLCSSTLVLFSECMYTFENVGRGNQPQGGVENSCTPSL